MLALTIHSQSYVSLNVLNGRGMPVSSKCNVSLAHPSTRFPKNLTSILFLCIAADKQTEKPNIKPSIYGRGKNEVPVLHTNIDHVFFHEYFQ